MCPDLVTPEKKKIERYIRGLPERVKANVTSSKLASLHDAINMDRELIEQAIQAKQNRKQEAAKAYVAAPTEGKAYIGNLPLCNRCKALHHGLCPPRCGRCQKVGHHEKNYRVRAPTTGVFTPFIDIAPAALDTSYDVQIAYGKVVTTTLFSVVQP
ncbi:hypothetical protein Tco_1190682 [Tanacetum coccineum]